MKKIFLTLAIIFAFVLDMGAQKPVKVACVGNSITYGAGITNREKNSYPAQLQAYLGDNCEVKNFGVSARTLLSKGDHPYIETDAYRQSLSFQPDIVLIKLGTNDTKPQNWQYKDDFPEDYQSLIDSYRALNSHPRIILLTPVRCFLEDDTSINPQLIEKEVCPMVEELALRNDLEIIDMFNLFDDEWKQYLMPDRLHPSSIGAGMMAQKIYDFLSIDAGNAGATDATGKRVEGKRNHAVHPVPGNEFRTTVGWIEGADWYRIIDDITETLEGKKLKLLLLGNSIMQGWGGTRKAITTFQGKEAMNAAVGEGVWETAGVASDRTQHLLWRMQNADYKICKPENVVIAIGINNLGGGDTPEDTAEGILAVVDEARMQFPDAHIILLGLFPAGKEKQAALRVKCDKVHDILSAYGFKGVRYVNPTRWYVDENGTIKDGLYGSDYIHLTSDGYKVAADKIAELMQ